MSELSERLKTWRTANKLTQRKMAEALGCTERYYQGMESGEYKPGGAMGKLIEIIIKSEVE